jgi:hypothetical protein
MRFHTIYRATHKENTKPRPPGYSQLTCLRSFLRACAACPDMGEMLFFNDGPVPTEQTDEMTAAGGEIVAAKELDILASFWGALELALSRGWADDDVVYFAENDYLYREEAFSGVVEAARQLPDGAYLAPYATVGHQMPNGEPLHEGLRRPRISDEPLAEAGGVTWRRALSHAGSFAARVGTLRADMAVFRLAPRTGGAWDHATSLGYQGIVPFTPAGVVEPMRLRMLPLERRAKTVFWRAALCALALAVRRRGRILASSRPSLTTHMEIGLLAQGTDWEAEARAADEWARKGGVV